MCNSASLHMPNNKFKLASLKDYSGATTPIHTMKIFKTQPKCLKF